MKVITFLGTDRYDEVTYVWKEESAECTTELFPKALAQWFPEAEILVLLTKEAKNSPRNHWDNLKETLGDRVKPVDIQMGKGKEQLWKNFKALTECVQAGDEIVLDITHGFRSLPVVALLAIAFLQSTGKVTLKHLLYGADEARDKKKNEPVPVFDLSDFLKLFQWMTATDQFLNTGNGLALANLLSEDKPPLKDLKESIQQISEGLHLMRPKMVMQQADQLGGRITAAAPELPAAVPPFVTLLERVQEDYCHFGFPDPQEYKDKAKVKENLLKQLEMAKWYFERDQLVHAVSAAREWVPSLLCYHFGLDLFDDNYRHRMEAVLTGKKSRKEGDTVIDLEKLYVWSTVPEGNRLKDLWTADPDRQAFKDTGKVNLANLRNDVLHSGYRKKPRDPEDIRKETDQALKELRDIAKAWNLPPPV